MTRYLPTFGTGNIVSCILLHIISSPGKFLMIGTTFCLSALYFRVNRHPSLAKTGHI